MTLDLFGRGEPRTPEHRHEVRHTQTEEEGRLFLHEGEGEAEEAVLLCNAGEGAGPETGDGVDYMERRGD